MKNSVTCAPNTSAQALLVLFHALTYFWLWKAPCFCGLHFFLTWLNFCSSASPEATWETKEDVWNLFPLALLAMFFCSIYACWEVRMIQTEVPYVPSAGFDTDRVTGCHFICCCLSKMKQTPETTFTGNFKTTSLKTAYFPSAGVREAKAQENFLTYSRHALPQTAAELAITELPGSGKWLGKCSF